MHANLYHYTARVVRVVDGDTVDVIFDLGFSICYGNEKKPVRLRLASVNTPELYGVKKTSDEYKEGLAAKARAIELVEGKDVIIRTIKDKTGKYGRYLAEVIYIDEEGTTRSLAQTLIAEGLGTPV